MVCSVMCHTNVWYEVWAITRATPLEEPAPGYVRMPPLSLAWIRVMCGNNFSHLYFCPRMIAHVRRALKNPKMVDSLSTEVEARFYCTAPTLEDFRIPPMTRHDWSVYDTDPFNPMNPHVIEYWKTPEFSIDVTQVEFDSKLNFGIMLKSVPDLSKPLPFEILAHNEFTGNLDCIDEDPRSYARYFPDRQQGQVEVRFGEARVFLVPWYMLNRFEPLALRIQMLVRRTMRSDHLSMSIELPAMRDMNFVRETAFRIHPPVRLELTSDQVDVLEQMGPLEQASKLPLRDPPMHVDPSVARSAMQAINAGVIARATAVPKAPLEAPNRDPNYNPWGGCGDSRSQTRRRRNWQQNEPNMAG